MRVLTDLCSFGESLLDPMLSTLSFEQWDTDQGPPAPLRTPPHPSQIECRWRDQSARIRFGNWQCLWSRSLSHYECSRVTQHHQLPSPAHGPLMGYQNQIRAAQLDSP